MPKNAAFDTIMEELNTRLTECKADYLYRMYGCLGYKIIELEALIAAISQISNENQVNLNQPIATYKDGKDKRYTSLLNIAVRLCSSMVVEFLLQHGAKADNKTVFQLVKSENPDTHNILGVLKNHNIDLNSMNKKLQTPLYVARTTYKDEAANSLAYYNARMLFNEKMKEPLVKTKDLLLYGAERFIEYMPYIKLLP